MPNTVGYHDYVDQLSETEQRRLLDNLIHRFGTNGTNGTGKRVGRAAREYSPSERMVFAAVVGAINNGYANTPMAPIVESKQLGYAKYAEQVVAVNDYITHGCNATLNTARRQAILQKVMKCLVQHIASHTKTEEGWGVPTSAVSILNVLKPSNFGLLPSAVERNFPGYVKARLLHLIAPVNGWENRLI